MNDLIPISRNDDGTIAVSGRALHTGLDISTPYAKWFARMAEYGFTAGQDYEDISVPVPSIRSDRAYEQTDHALTIDAAKEIAMIQRTERGQQVRRYFIAAEKKLRTSEPKELTDEQIVHQALTITTRKVQELEATVAEQAPKVEAYESFLDADGCYSIGTVAKMLGLGQKRLFDELHARKVLIPTGHLRNTPYSHLMHHFRVSAYTYENSKTGQAGTSYTTKVRPTGVDYIRRKLGMASAPMLEVA